VIEPTAGLDEQADDEVILMAPYFLSRYSSVTLALLCVTFALCSGMSTPPRASEVHHSLIKSHTLAELQRPIDPNASHLQDAIASLAPRKANWDLRRDVAKVRIHPVGLQIHPTNHKSTLRSQSHPLGIAKPSQSPHRDRKSTPSYRIYTP
jgi:hypothetical protein